MQINIQASRQAKTGEKLLSQAANAIGPIKFVIQRHQGAQLPTARLLREEVTGEVKLIIRAHRHRRPDATIQRYENLLALVIVRMLPH